MAESDSRWPRPRYTMKWHEDNDAVLGARWWNESLDSVGLLSKRTALKALVYGGGTLATVLVVRSCLADRAEMLSQRSVDIQKRYGWHVGTPTTTFTLRDVSLTDAQGSADWTQLLANNRLSLAVCPADGRWRAFCQTTLFRAPEDDGTSTMKAALSPTSSFYMKQAYRQGLGIKALTSHLATPSETAVVLDLPGPLSVAAAAALAHTHEPVFLFDNWPHPQGVVPSHETLSAALYYASSFESLAKERAAKTDVVHPPVFVLDDKRLARVSDDVNTFDNRYVVTMPTAAALKERGVKRLIYVREGAVDLPELDDLNETFLSYEQNGVTVRALTLDDFAQDYGGPRGDETLHWAGQDRLAGAYWNTLGIAMKPEKGGAFLSSVSDAQRRMFAYKPERRQTIFTAPVQRFEGYGLAAGYPHGFGYTIIYRDRSTGALLDRRPVSGSSSSSGSWRRSSSSFSG